MNFESPGFLWLLPLVSLLWLAPRGSVDLRRALLRGAVMSALLLGLARPVWIQATWRDHHVVVVDRTASVANQGAVDRALEGVVARLQPDAVRVLIELGGAAVDVPAGFDELVRVPGDARSPIGDALNHALRAVPEGAGGAVTLISDGRSTDDGWHDAAQELTERGVPLHAVAIEAADEDVRPVGLRPLDELRVGHVGRVREHAGAILFPV